MSNMFYRILLCALFVTILYALLRPSIAPYGLKTCVRRGTEMIDELSDSGLRDVLKRHLLKNYGINL